jgi:hypothetical protein
MKILGLNILTDEELRKLKDEYIKEAFACYKRNFEQAGIISRLEYLKKDHWDKDAFDSIITLLTIYK